VSQHILVVEDDPDMARILRDNLEHEGYAVVVVGTGRDALKALHALSIDLVLLDLRLPDADGFDLCKELSKNPSSPPVIIVSARSQQEDRVRGFRVGADDYVTKPFNTAELLERIRRTLRRTQPPSPVAPALPRVGRLRLGEIDIDFDKRVATRHGQDIGLSERELNILQYFAQRPRQVVTRDELMAAVWGDKDLRLSRPPVDLAIHRLRLKIEPDPANPRYIRTVHGGGYRFTPD
jgi:DNA-binding response OmpR family regulator